MGTPHSKPTEQTTSSHVPPGPMEGTNVDDSNEGIIPVADDVDKIYPRSPGVHITPSERMIFETDGDSTYDTPGPMEGTNVDDSNEGVIHVADNVHKIYPSSPGVHITPSEWMILEQTDCERTYVHQPSHLITDNHPISFLYTVDSLPDLSNLTKELASMQRDNEEKRPQNVPRHPLSDITNAYQPSSMDLDEKRELIKARRRAAYQKKKEEPIVKQQDENLSALTISDVQNVTLSPLGDIANGCQPTSVDLDEKKEQINARRRAAYRKKKEEATFKQQDGNLSSLTISDMQNVPLLPLGDITNGCQPTSVDLDEKKEQIKARRRAAYRKKKEEAASKQQDENLAALTKSDIQNVPLLPLGDITNGCQPTSVDLDEKKEQIKARRRAAYRKKKEEAATKQQDENLPALTKSANPTTSSYTSWSYDDAPLPPSTASGVIHDKKQARRQNDKERKRNLRLRDGQREQENAQRRADYRKNVDNGTIDLQQKNQNQREWRMQHRESMTSDEKGESSAQRKAKYAAKKNTLCAESIAMPRPDLTSTMSDSHAAPDFRSTSVCLDGGPAMSMPTYPVGTDGIMREDRAPTVKAAPTYIRNIETDGAYLSRTLGDGAVDGNLSKINEHLTSADQQTSHPLTIADNGADQQRHESKTQPRTRERSCKGSMAAKKCQEKIGKRKSCTKVPRGERNALLDRRNESFAGRVKTPTVRSISIPEMSSTGQPTVVEAHGASTSSSTPEYTIRSENDMDAYLSRLMNDNVNPDNLFDDEYYLFAAEGSDADDMEHDELEDSSHNSYVDHDPLDYVYSNLPDHTHILKHAANCVHCKAKKFVSEASGFCCRSGQIERKQPELMRLWSSMDADSRHFRENIRFFNGHFSFTTLGVSLDESYTNMKSGVYTFRAHGTIYHNVHSFGPTSRPEHLQLYF
ncbi:uncharacterized protein [Triticum aestivum]|uniref:uncharacterized protein n=1 Tax=Triticum aestivum TaxID=4565 RepID=UPI001D0255A2|nr:uncharacterized protein LOC123097270 [Triticum aestivum]